MMITPVIVCCWKGIDAVHIVHQMAGKTNGREADQGTIRGDFSMSVQENIVHTSDTVENAEVELARFSKTKRFLILNRIISGFIRQRRNIVGGLCW